jgi:hypothetical protein
MAIGTSSVGKALNLTASGQVAGGTAMARTRAGGAGTTAQSTQAETTALAGTILGFYVNSTSSGTVALSAGTASGGTALTGTITPAIGWHTLPLTEPTGIYATIGATLNVTFAVVE